MNEQEKHSTTKRLELWVKSLLNKVIDFFYPWFEKFMSRQLFSYGFCGGLNLALDWVLYYVFYHFIIRGRIVDLGFVAISPHIAAFAFRLPITFLTGFWMARHISFTGSELRGRVQITRYLLVTVVNIVINYAGLKLFVDVFEWWPTISYIIISVICVTFSYLSNKYFSFRKKRKDEHIE